MPGILYVDFSAKIEQWTRDSAVALANEQQSRTLLLPKKVKQKSRQLIKKVYGAKSIQFRLLAVLVYLVARELLAEIDTIVIDKDYAGEDAEATITNLLLIHLRSDKRDVTAEMIRFENIKGSRADKLAKDIFDGKMQADRTVQYSEIARLIEK